MITQNPIIGKARKKLAGVYARTLYGKNVIQTCPPPTKGKQPQTLLDAQQQFAFLSQLSRQIPTSLLNNIYYTPPTGRNRRQQLTKDLATGSYKDGSTWLYNPSLISRIGSNPKTSETPNIITITQVSTTVPLDSLSHVGNAITSETPCIILIDPADALCVSLLDNSTIEGSNLVLSNLSTTLLGKECWLFPLWLVNIGTVKNPIYQYGSYVKSNE